jgi:hypothetical protein
MATNRRSPDVFTTGPGRARIHDAERPSVVDSQEIRIEALSAMYSKYYQSEAVDRSLLRRPTCSAGSSPDDAIKDHACRRNL